MSIADKIPTPPENTAWSVDVADTKEGPKAWVNLVGTGVDGAVAIMYSPGPLLSELTEEAIIATARTLLSAREESIIEARGRSERLERYRSQYAHLMTGN